MIIWIDAQLPPAIAKWISDCFKIEAIAVRDLGLRDATDEQIFQQARAARAVVMSKDKDFLDLVRRKGVPPKVIWINCGNTSNQQLKELLQITLKQAILLLENEEQIVEIRIDPPT